MKNLLTMDEWLQSVPDRFECVKRNVRWKDAMAEWLRKKPKEVKSAKS